MQQIEEFISRVVVVLECTEHGTGDCDGILFFNSPHDHAQVLGFDDHQLAATYGLSTVAQPVTELGRTAAAMALRLAAGERLAGRHVAVPTRLVLRRSTAVPSPSLRLTS